MSRLCAIAMLYATACLAAFASEAEQILEEEQTAPAAAARELADLPPEILEKLDRESIVEILLAREESGIPSAGGDRP